MKCDSVGILAFIFLFFCPLAMAQPGTQGNEECNFKLECKVGSRGFSFDFKSKSGACPEEDMQATLTRKGTVKTLKLPPGWYSPIWNLTNLQSVCQGSDAHETKAASAYPVSETQILLFLKSDNRPGYDDVAAALFDIDKTEILDFKILGPTKNHYVAILRSGDGFKLAVARPLKDVNCDCDAAFAEYWIKVGVKNNKIRQSDLKP